MSANSYDRADRIDDILFRVVIAVAILFFVYNGARAWKHFDNWKAVVTEESQ